MIIHKIDIHLEDWSVSYPTGAIAYDVEGNIVDSDYCDTAEEFIEFLDSHKDEINWTTTVHVIFDIVNIDNDECAVDCAREIKKHVDFIKYGV